MTDSKTRASRRPRRGATEASPKITWTPRQWKAISSPIRLELLALAEAEQPCSIGDLARASGRRATGLYRHVRILATAGLFEPCGQRPGARRPEQLYRVSPIAGRFGLALAEESAADRYLRVEMAALRACGRGLRETSDRRSSGRSSRASRRSSRRGDAIAAACRTRSTCSSGEGGSSSRPRRRSGVRRRRRRRDARTAEVCASGRARSRRGEEETRREETNHGQAFRSRGSASGCARSRRGEEEARREETNHGQAVRSRGSASGCARSRRGEEETRREETNHGQAVRSRGSASG
ncbi:MAG: Helix-turn-helix domain, partial [Planctomycetota bacterium]